MRLLAGIFFILLPIMTVVAIIGYFVSEGNLLIGTISFIVPYVIVLSVVYGNHLIWDEA
jgi:uncharacterized membrane protein